MNGRISIDGRNFHNILPCISSLEFTTIGTYYSRAATIEGISVDKKDCSHLTITTSEAFVAAYYLVDRDAAPSRNYRLCMTFGDKLSL